MLFPVSRSFIQYFSHSFADVSTFLCSKYLSICANCIALLCIWLLHYNTKHIPIRTENENVCKWKWMKKKISTHENETTATTTVNIDRCIDILLDEWDRNWPQRANYYATDAMFWLLCVFVYILRFRSFSFLMQFHSLITSLLTFQAFIFMCVICADYRYCQFYWFCTRNICTHTPNTHTHSALSFSILTVCMGRYLQRLTIHFIRNWSYSYFLLRFVSLLSVPLFDHVASGIFSRRQTNFSHIHT